MPEIITSTANDKIKRLIRLRERKERDESGLTIIEGEREILRAVDAGVEILEAYHCGGVAQDALKKIAAAAAKHQGALFETNQKVFARAAYGEKEEGIMAVAKIRPKDLNDLKRDASALLLVLEGIEKPGNVGAILRTADAAGISGVILTESATDLYNPNTIRASLGAVFSVNVALCDNKTAYDFLMAHKIHIVATTPEAKKKYTQVDLREPLALVMGSEDKGLSPFWLERSMTNVFIPMKGAIDSLNVSTAAAVLLYEIIRQRSSQD